MVTPERGREVPVIVRVAGLAAELMDELSSRPLAEQIEAREELCRRIAEMRSALVACLHEAIRDTPKEKRGFLLSAKRDCFNARSLRAYQEHPEWKLLNEIAGSLADSVIDLEREIEAQDAGFEELYRRELHREWNALLRLLDDPAFLRGLTLASPELARNLVRLHGKAPGGFGRRERRLMLTLVRYASRAAVKLSPFSTLTRVGLGLVANEETRGFELRDAGRWQERSTVSLRRELLNQCSFLLLRSPRFTEALDIRLNDTLAQGEDGRFFLFHPDHWEFGAESRAFKYCEERFIRVRLEGPLVPWLIAELGGGAMAYRDLRDRLRSAFADEDQGSLEGDLGDLLAIGFLSFVLPWGPNEPDLERRMLEHLAPWRSDAELGPFVRRFGELVHRLSLFSEPGSPLARIEEIRRGTEELFASALAWAGLGSGIEFQAEETPLDEDVFLLPAPQPDAAGAGEIARLSRDRAEEILRSVDPILRLSNLDSRRHDLLHTLSVAAARRWPGQADVGFLEFCQAVQPLFRQYLRYSAEISTQLPLLAPAFNPLDLEPVRSLERVRQDMAREALGCLREAGDGQRLCPEALNALLDQVHGPYAAAREFCAFVQPLEPEGRTWVLNAFFEGHGRLSSRHTAAMDERMREGWISSFLPLSSCEIDGEPAELVDVSCPERRTINVHAAQTWRALKMPGESSELSPERLLRLRDLRVRLRGPGAFPVLTDAAGRRLLPVQFGSLSPWLTPTLHRLLVAFGPGEIRPALPQASPRVEDGLRIVDRHTSGNVVYVRRSWTLDPRPLLARLEGASEARAFEAIHRWRTAKGIPGRVFVLERVHLGKNVFHRKPQSLDLSSPSFVQVFLSILKEDSKVLVLEETLPAPDRFPGSCGRWGVEVQLESFALRRAPLSAKGPSHDAGV
jgi:hypothetical protein